MFEVRFKCVCRAFETRLRCVCGTNALADLADLPNPGPIYNLEGLRSGRFQVWEMREVRFKSVCRAFEVLLRFVCGTKVLADLADL